MLRKSLVGLLLLVLVGAAAWVVAARMESPEQAAARAQPPAPVPVVAQIHSGFLAAGVTMSVTAERQETRTVEAPPEMTGVVTAQVLAPGANLAPGAAALRVDGRPVFAIPGSFPLYRDIEPGDEGDDVTAVQQGLRQAGLYKGLADGRYGPGTQAAVTAMYKAAGYDAPRSGPVEEVDQEQGHASQAAAVPGGPRLLRTEVLVVGTLPATVEALAPVGSRLGEGNPPLVLVAGDTVLRTRVPLAAVGVLVEGATGTFTADGGGQGQGTVTAIVRDDATGEVEIVLTVGQGLVTAGTTYTVSVANPANETGANLLVPITAVVTRGGSSYVYVEGHAGFTEVQVQVIGQRGGTAAVAATVSAATPLVEGAGVRVNVGTSGADTADGSDGDDG